MSGDAYAYVWVSYKEGIEFIQCVTRRGQHIGLIDGKIEVMEYDCFALGDDLVANDFAVAVLSLDSLDCVNRVRRICDIDRACDYTVQLILILRLQTLKNLTQ